jgi:hypothetical protein
MTITKPQFLYRIDHKQAGSHQEMEKAIAALKLEISQCFKFLQSVDAGEHVLSAGTYDEICAARARAKFYFQLLEEGCEHYQNTAFRQPLQRALSEAGDMMNGMKVLYAAIAALYKD